MKIQICNRVELLACPHTVRHGNSYRGEKEFGWARVNKSHGFSLAKVLPGKKSQTCGLRKFDCRSLWDSRKFLLGECRDYGKSILGDCVGPGNSIYVHLRCCGGWGWEEQQLERGPGRLLGILTVALLFLALLTLVAPLPELRFLKTVIVLLSTGRKLESEVWGFETGLGASRFIWCPANFQALLPLLQLLILALFHSFLGEKVQFLEIHFIAWSGLKISQFCRIPLSICSHWH